MHSVLKQIEDFARKAHCSQRRKFVDEMYIEHPIRVMKTCREVTQHLPILAGALLHDVVEDTPVSYEEIEAFLLTVMSRNDVQETLAIVKDLTDIYTHAAYPKLNRRARKEKENERLKTTGINSRTIKYADIIDNAAGLEGNDFAPKFLREVQYNLRNIPGGDPTLYQRAIEAVEAGLAKIHR